MKYIEAPTGLSWQNGMRSLFLAGGITGCPDWQQDMRQRLSDTDLVLLNPRRADFPIGEYNAGYNQIKWEHEHLRMSNAILFWFCAETLNPIVLYELGAWSMTNKPIFVGTHPAYKRIRDVEVQTGFARPEIDVVYSLEALAKNIEQWVSNPHMVAAVEAR